MPEIINSLKPFVLAFIPIFVAVDVIGTVPLFISLVEGINKKEKQRVIAESVTTATVMAILFMFIGKWVLRFIGITISDFQIAGGTLLFFISVRLLLPTSQKAILSDGHDKDVGVFPLGTPLITGPAVLTTILIILDTYGIAATFVALIVNMVIVWLTLIKADFLIKIFGAGGTRAFSKVMYILLASIGVMMIRRGIVGIWIK